MPTPVVFASTRFREMPLEYQGSRQLEEPLDVLYALAACDGVAEAAIVDPWAEEDEAALRDARVVVLSTTNTYLQWNNHPLGLSQFLDVWRHVRTVKRDGGPWRAVVFGPHVANHRAELLAAGVDVALAGESELRVAGWVERCLANDSDPLNVTGEEAVVHAVGDLDDLPRPAWGHALRWRFAAHNRPQPGAGHLYETSRGCPYFCSFCNTVTHRRQHRLKSVEKVASDLAWLAEHSDRRYVYFIDESFGFRDAETFRLLDALRALPIEYGCQANLRFMSPAKLEAMAAAGFVSLEFGMETGDAGLLRQVGKDNRLAEAADLVNHAAGLGLDPLLFLLVGLPGETPATLRRTLELLSALHPATRVSIAMPTPYTGTRLHQLGVRSGLVPADASGAALYAYTGRIGHDLAFAPEAADRFRSRYGPNNRLEPGFVAGLERDLGELFGAALP